jgi:UDP-4-amino-4,6-dideoxy-N-acetyl-beta-L-altrosamine N-acetyltransferase
LNNPIESLLSQPERIDGYHISMRKIEFKDIELARQWRNLPHVRNMMLDTAEITAEQQQEWFQKVSQRSDQWHFMIEYQSKPIGVANIKSNDANITVGTKVEIGLYIGEEAYRDNMIAFAPNLLLIDFCFEQLKLVELSAVVKEDNDKAMQYNYALGYRVDESESLNNTHRDKDNQLIKLKLTQDDYSISTRMVKAFLERK